jgi:hypothetical protein
MPSDPHNFRAAFEKFVQQLDWLMPNPRQKPVTLEQLQIGLSEWEKLEPLGRKLTDHGMKRSYERMMAGMDKVRARLRLNFISEELDLVTTFMNWRIAECGIVTARVAKQLLELSPDDPEVRAKYGHPKLSSNQLIGQSTEQAEKAEKAFQEQLKRLKRRWPAEWYGPLAAVVEQDLEVEDEIPTGVEVTKPHEAEMAAIKAKYPELLALPAL